MLCYASRRGRKCRAGSPCSPATSARAWRVDDARADALAARAREAACSASQALGLRGYGRVDLRLAGDGRLVDVNPNPDLGEAEVLARSAACAGIDYTSLIETVVGQALGESCDRGISREA